MKKSRAPLLLMVLAGLGVLVWLDNAGEPESNVAVVAPADRPAVSTPTGAEPTVSGAGELEPLDEGAPINPLAAIKRDNLADTVERPLFVRSRRAYKPPVRKAPQIVAKPPRVAKPPPPSYTLLGTILGRKARIALLRQKGKAKDLSVKQGDKLGSWQVRHVASNSVVLADGSNTMTLEVFPDAPTRNPGRRTRKQ